MTWSITVFDRKVGNPPGTFSIWPGPPFSGNAIGGSGSKFYNDDLNTWVMTAHYVSDTVKVGLLYQLIHDPKTISAAFLVGGISDQGFFAGEPVAYAVLAGATGAGWPTPARLVRPVRFRPRGHV